MKSATFAEMRGGQEYREWDEQMYLTAGTYNAVRSLSYITVLANSDPDKRKPNPPNPYPIPGHKDTKSQEPKPGSFLAIASQLLAAKREKKRKAALCQEAQAEEK